MKQSQLDLMITGALTKDYLPVSTTLNAMGDTIDAIIASEEHKDILSGVSAVYVHLKSLETSLEGMLADVNSYLDMTKEIAVSQEERN